MEKSVMCGEGCAYGFCVSRCEKLLYETRLMKTLLSPPMQVVPKEEPEPPENR